MPPRLQPPSTDIAVWLTERLAGYLSVAPADIRHDVPLAHYGLDSVFALSLCGDIEDRYEIPVDPTLAWDYPTVDLVVGFIEGELGRVDR
jgi:acyl carrier protein